MSQIPRQRETHVRVPAEPNTTAVITIVHGRHQHLLRQQQHLVVWAPDVLRVVVAMDDPEVAAVMAAYGFDEGAIMDSLPLQHGELPLAAARNLGARAATEAGADLLVFLDVDVLVGPGSIGAYQRAARQSPDHLMAGAVTYLAPEDLPIGVGMVRTACLRALRNPHPARPDPGLHGPLVSESNYDLFWSLNFALSAPLWGHLNGFDEEFYGYGSEDTDFAERARRAGIAFGWVPGADGWHQHHPSEDPPVRHVVAICRNANRFHSLYGRWPMEGWLRGFEAAGLVYFTGDFWVPAPEAAEVAAGSPGPGGSGSSDGEGQGVRPTEVRKG